ncbi:hypothetical protein FOA43_000710 [Brettanomyces nanus]|uniref:Protein phosphatase methylesterase 1 n=1 Tax=Eeniella nana TaxID=13502 RepID=A0A875RNA3_EENNA|nr:uncharacterized protein FOA43_000710 [Brettanomyces nanus]QPG73400.1 hypothetical protein FOA43_000710 [Brettanomyces nanus]
MSDFQRKLFQNKLLKAEHSLGFDAGDDETEDSFGDLTPLPNLRNGRRHSIEEDHDSRVKEDKEYVEKLPKWTDFFDNNDIYRDTNSGYCFQTYYAEPILKERMLADTFNNPVIFVAHHGAGSSGLTFAKLAESIKRQVGIQSYDSTPGLFTYDMRGHANTMMLNQDTGPKLNYSVSIEQLCKDFVFVLTQFYNSHFASGSCPPSIFLLGHSLGGSVLTKIVYEMQQGVNPFPKSISDLIKGLIMVDIVEDTAVSALDSMDSYLRGVPKQFLTLKDAIDWHINTGMLNNRKSAIISVPALVSKSSSTSVYHWVTDLSKTSPYWHSWFTGLSSHFIHITNAVSKMLILVNNDYLDKNLMIGQMQGRYQLLVFHNNQLQLKNTLTTQTQTISSEDSDQLGHFVHEDIPDKVAISILEFVERNDYQDLFRSENATINSKTDMLNKLNAKWGVGKK